MKFWYKKKEVDHTLENQPADKDQTAETDKNTEMKGKNISVNTTLTGANTEADQNKFSDSIFAEAQSLQRSAATPLKIVNPKKHQVSNVTQSAKPVIRLRPLIVKPTNETTPTAIVADPAKTGVAALAAFRSKQHTESSETHSPLPLQGSATTPTSAAQVADHSTARPKSDQRALYYQLMNGLYDAILILDDKGFVVDCNTRFSDILGYDREDAWNMPVSQIISGMTPQMLLHLQQSLQENHHILLDARCARKDGSSFTAEVGVSSFSLTKGNNIVFMIRSVERRKRAMEELRKTRAAFEISLSPAFVCNTDGFFESINQTFREAFGFAEDENLSQRSFVELLPSGGRAFLRAACGEKIQERLRVELENGAEFELDVVLEPIKSGEIITAVAGSIDPR